MGRTDKSSRAKGFADTQFYCEYRRCGGLGHRETKIRYIARTHVQVGRRSWNVCEHCADLLKRDYAEAIHSAHDGRCKRAQLPHQPPQLLP